MIWVLKFEVEVSWLTVHSVRFLVLRVSRADTHAGVEG
jgi:hypothetical protein